MMRNRSVMPIFWASSGIVKMVMSLFMSRSPDVLVPGGNGRRVGRWRGGERSGPVHRRSTPRPHRLVERSRLLRRPGFHLVADGPLGRRDDLGGAAAGRDLLGGRLGEVVRPDHELFRHVAGAQDTDAVALAVGQAGLAERVVVDG